MSLSKDDIQKLATLARIGVDDTIASDVASKISDILAMVDHRDIEKGDIRTLAEDIAAAAHGSPLQRLGSAQLAERLRTLEERRAERQAAEKARRDAERLAAVVETFLTVHFGFFLPVP